MVSQDSSGEVVESDEMRPQWFGFDELPLSHTLAEDALRLLGIGRVDGRDEDRALRVAPGLVRVLLRLEVAQ